MDLTQELPHLLRRAHFEAEAKFSDVFGTLPITSRQAAMLLVIMQRPGISQRDLGDHLKFDANTVSAIVSRLLDRQWIRREPAKTDRRSQILTIEPAGCGILGDVLPSIADYQSRLAHFLNPEERQQLVLLLQRLLGFEFALAT